MRYDRDEAMIYRVDAAEDHVRSRWSITALNRVAPKLAARLRWQREKWTVAVSTGTSPEIQRHGTAMLKGWQAAEKALADVEHDAYLVGMDAASGTIVVISDRKTSLESYRDRHPDRRKIIHVTPEEVATIIAGLGVASRIKQAMGGEIAGVRIAHPDDAKPGSVSGGAR